MDSSGKRVSFRRWSLDSRPRSRGRHSLLSCRVNVSQSHRPLDCSALCPPTIRIPHSNVNRCRFHTVTLVRKSNKDPTEGHDTISKNRFWRPVVAPRSVSKSPVQNGRHPRRMCRGRPRLSSGDVHELLVEEKTEIRSAVKEGRGQSPPPVS